jgi:hypothetical protein
MLEAFHATCLIPVDGEKVVPAVAAVVATSVPVPLVVPE